MTPEQAAAMREAAADRNSGHSRLVYDKGKRTIVRVDTHVEPKADPRDAALAEMIKGHVDVWRQLLEAARDRSEPPTEDMDDGAYYQHELDALAAIESALKGGVT